MGPSVITAGNGGEFIELSIARSSSGVASTSDGRFFLRISDTSSPVLGDDVMRLASERSALPWETLTSMEVPRTEVDAVKLAMLVAGLRGSDRVKASVKEKRDDELLDHYQLARGEWLTHLGVLCVGRQGDRARLGSAPVIQFIKRDAQEQKVNKLTWDDYTLSPMELVDAVCHDVPDFGEFYEVADGLFRSQVPAFDERVIRELLINALVHRPYTQRGDIYLNLHPDRLEIVNPGPLPLGVTPGNVLHASVRRNEHLARLCAWGLVGRSGRTQATRYFVQPELLRSLAFPAVTTLKSIEDHRLQALVLEDLARYPQSAIGDIHKRIGPEIARRRLQGMLAKLLNGGQIRIQGERRWARYSLAL